MSRRQRVSTFMVLVELDSLSRPAEGLWTLNPGRGKRSQPHWAHRTSHGLYGPVSSFLALESPQGGGNEDSECSGEEANDFNSSDGRWPREVSGVPK